jgi:hypothetical protein
MSALASELVLGGQDGSFTVEVTAEFGLNTQPGVTLVNSMQSAMTTGMTVTAQPDKNAIVMTGSLGTQSTTAAVTNQTAITLTAVATHSVSAGIVNSADADWTGFLTQITVGKEIQADPYRILAVAADRRVLHVLPEARIIQLPCESRDLRVAQPKYDPVLDRRVA